jgi:hypothetical protein
MIAGATATRNAHENSEHTQHRYPIKCIHSLILLEFGVSSHEAGKFG